MAYSEDKNILRELAKEVAGIAALPVQEEKRSLWRKSNGLKQVRPMVMIDQVCWPEMDFDGYLAPRCGDKKLHGYENHLRRTLYQWKYFPVDKAVEPYVRVGMAVRNTFYGLEVREDIQTTDPKSEVLSHRYIDQLVNDDDLEKITMPEITHDAAETARRLDLAHDIFDGVIDVKLTGSAPGMRLWDPIATFKGVENACYALADNPDFMHRLLKRMMWSFTGMIDQLEEKGLLMDARLQTDIHCTGAYTDELPAPGYNPDKPRCKDLWTSGTAQMFSNVGPAMHQEFSLDYENPIYARFGLINYGCCEPLDRKIEIVTKIPNVRKISMSPWANPERGAEGLGPKFIYCGKPNPAFLAGSSFDDETVRKELMRIKAACARNNCPLELILKDVSTVKYKPQRLFRWAEIAMEVAAS